MKKTAPTENKSLKTFYLYLFAVILLIAAALFIKGIIIVKDSKFDASHDFALAVTENNDVKEIIAFHPQVPSITVLSIKDNKIPYFVLAKDYGIATDGYIQIANSSDINTDATAFMWSSFLHTDSWQTNLTILDKIRLLLFSKNVTTNNKTVEKISLANQNSTIQTTITNALTDQDIADENISVQIINATDITGFGQRLANVLTTMGANVVEVSTSQNIQKQTTIQYYGDESYTLDRLENLVGVTGTKIETQQIANIIITLGTDKKDIKTF